MLISCLGDGEVTLNRPGQCNHRGLHNQKKEAGESEKT